MLKRIGAGLGSIFAVMAMAMTGVLAVVMGFVPSASAAVFTPSVYSGHLAGYAGFNNGTKAYNDVRWNVVAPDETASSVPADTIAVGGVLQELPNVPSGTVGLGLVWDDTVNTSGLSCDNGRNIATSWVLEQGTSFTGAPGVPLPPGQLRPIPASASTVFCVAPGERYYMEIHDSTLFNKVAFVAGDTEPGNTLGYNANITKFFGPGARFTNFGVGIDATSAGDTAGLLSHSVFAFTRDGLTQLLGNVHAVAPGTNSRLTLNSEGLRAYIATATGAAPTPVNPVTLAPSGLGTGSAFTVTVP
jgi:hypothetical protein